MTTDCCRSMSYHRQVTSMIYRIFYEIILYYFKRTVRAVYSIQIDQKYKAMICEVNPKSCLEFLKCLWRLVGGEVIYSEKEAEP